MKKIFFLMVVNVFLIQDLLHPAEIALKDLHKIAHACNNEGGSVALLLGKNTKWFCLEAVFDRPFLDDSTLEDITAQNPFPLKESNLIVYNEAKVNMAQLLLITFLVDHAHRLSELPTEDPVKIIIQVHRRSSALPQIDLIINMLRAFYNGENIKDDVTQNNVDDYHRQIDFIDKKVSIIFRNGAYKEHFYGYETAQLVLSLGIVLGLHKDWHSGTLIFPDTFTSFDENESIIDMRQKYCVKNWMGFYLNEILSDRERQQKAIQVINNKATFRSFNPKKQGKINRNLTINDFNNAQILQIKTLWNPKNHDKKVQIIK